MKVVFSARARAGLRGIALYIARDNRARAIIFVEELRDKARALAEMPLAFPLVPGHEPIGLRRRPHGDYLILYRVEDARVVILDIVHAARDWQGLFR